MASGDVSTDFAGVVRCCWRACVRVCVRACVSPSYHHRTGDGADGEGGGAGGRPRPTFGRVGEQPPHKVRRGDGGENVREVVMTRVESRPRHPQHVEREPAAARR